MNYKASQSDCWEQTLLWTSINATLCQLLSFCEVVSQFWVISSLACIDPCGYMYFSLYVALSPVPLTYRLYPSPIPHSQPYLFNSRRPLHAAWVLLSAPLSGNFLKTVRSAKSRAFLFACQHSGLLLLLPDAYVLKNFYFNCFICFMIISGQS